MAGGKVGMLLRLIGAVRKLCIQMGCLQFLKIFEDFLGGWCVYVYGLKPSILFFSEKRERKKNPSNFYCRGWLF